MTTRQRMSLYDDAPDAYKAVFPLQKYVTSGDLGAALIAIVDIRASQINHCAWCLDMHTAEARNAGIPQRKIDLVAAWREATGLFDEREQAALEFTEEVTLIHDGGVPDDVWDRVREAFSEDQIAHLLMAIAAINVWNRMNVTARTDLPAEANG